MKRLILAFSLILSIVGIINISHASPFGIVKILYIDNKDGTYTYYMSVVNQSQPIGTEVATPPDHMIFNWQTQSMVPAGGKLLSQDENVVVFGIDTENDEVEITAITDADTAFHGTAENGFNDSDNDGIPNRVIAWHLPFDGFTLDDTIQSESRAGIFSFTLNQEITQFSYWIGGSDDTNIWNDGNDMLEDNYGIYDASIFEYLATFLTRNVKARKINNRNKIKHLMF